MAIIVTNPSTVQFSGAATEPQDPAAITLEAGFTEELANAMLPPGQQADSASAAQKLAASAAEAKLNDLQILPADVLMNAVGEANFAFSAQGSSVAIAPQVLEETGEQAVLEALDPTQAAELAAAALAAQMGSPSIVVTDNVTLSQTANSIEAASALNAAQLAGNAAQAQGTLPQVSPQTLLQAPTTELNAVQSVQATDSVNSTNTTGLLQNQDLNVLTQNNAVESNAIGQSNPQNPVSIAKSAAEQGSEQLPMGIAQQAQTEIAKPQQPQVLESVNQTSIEVISNGQSGISNTQVETPTSTQVMTPTLGVTPQNSNAQEVRDAVPAVVANSATAPAGGQQSAFDVAGSDVVRPSDALAKTTQSSARSEADGSILDFAPETSGLEQPTVLKAAEDLQSQVSDTSSPLNPSMDKALQNLAAASEQESSFKFDAKLGAKSPNLVEMPKSMAAVVSTPVSLGGVVAPQAMTTAQSQGVLVESVSQANAVVPLASSAEENRPVTEPSAVLSASEPSIIENTNAYVVGSQVVSPQPNKLPNHLQAAPVAHETSDEPLDDLQANPVAVQSSSSGVVVPRTRQDADVNSKLDDSEPSRDVVISNLSTQQIAIENTQTPAAQSDSIQPAVNGFSEVSATFVSSLVGGPQRSVTTVMDWVALKPQEPPRPVMPHELRLDAGAVQVEIQRMVKQGGGHVVMELTPPDQSKFTIELKLDDMGGAYLRVEGVSDSTKTRLEQSAPQLQEQFQQMGLNLQLDMRQNRDSSSSASAEWATNEFGSNNVPTEETSPQATRAVAAERARKNNGSQIYLYA